MMRMTYLARLTMLCLLSPAVAMAQRPTPEDFARHAEVNEVAISPDGNYVAMAVPSADGMETQLHIVPLDGNGKVQALRFGRQDHVSGITWSDNGQVVVSHAKMEPLKAQPYSLGELFTSDINGKNQATLFAYVPNDGMTSGRRKDEGFASIAKVLDNEPGMIIVEFDRWRRSPDDKGAPRFTK